MIPKAEQQRTDELLDNIQKFWRHIFGGQRDLLQIFTAKRGSDGTIDRATIKSKFFAYPKAAEAAAKWALEKSEEGREVYYCSHLLTEARRVQENAAAVHCLWGDLDGTQVPNGELKPTAVVESSPGHYHAYWRLTDAIPADTAEQLNKRLAHKIGADPSGFDRTQLLRVPETTNYKYPDRPKVEILEVEGTHAYPPRQLEEILPTFEDLEGVHEPTDDSEEPPVVLGAEALKAWRGEKPKLKDDGKIDRSASLLIIGRVLYDASATRPTIVAALAERDEALGWRKYTGRRDAHQRYDEIVDELESNGRLDDGDLPKIVVNNRHLREVTAEALNALAARNDPPELFVRAGRLVRVREDENGIPEIQALEDSHVKGRLARVADFVRTTEKGETRVNPPDWTVKDVQALGRWPFPALEAVVEVPIVRPDGTIVDTPGYDPSTRLYYRPAEGFEMPKIPASPTSTDTQAAIRLLDEAVGEFPYEDRASAANTLALMLTPLVRPAVNGPVPLALIDKPQAGTGGSLLAEAVAIIGSGHTAEMLGAPRDEEEWRKQITAKLAAGATMITVDNVEGALYAPSLARALTARTWTDRVLGRSETITVGQRATWVATGNNIQLRGDLPRRCYSIRLDARESRPWQRQDFKHPDLLGWVAKNRGWLIHALLTLARAWFAAGKPKAKDLPRLGSFESWAETVGGMVAFAGIPDFLGNLEELYDKADAGGAEWEGFLYTWWEELDASKPITVADLTKRIDDNDTLKEALPGDLAEAFDKSTGSFSRKLGTALAKRAGTRYGEDGMHIVRAGEFRRAVRWKLDIGVKECEFVSLVSLIDPSAGNVSEEKKYGRGRKRLN